MDTCLAGNPYYPNRDTSLFHLTRPVCGVPDGQGLSEAEAVAVAKAQALALGATERSFATRETVMYDDVTRADTPVWRVSFTLPRDQSNAGWKDHDMVEMAAGDGSLLTARVLVRGEDVFYPYD